MQNSPHPFIKQFEHACPSIKYRLLSEIFGQSPSSRGMVELQTQILSDPTVRTVMQWQQPDGWLGWNFHGTKSIETGIRLLCEKGVKRNHPVLVKALHALEKLTSRLDRGLGKPGVILDKKGLGGALLIRATIFAYAGRENKPFIQEQINKALNGFNTVLAVRSTAEITENYKDKLVFRPDIQWPSIYHLRLLALTHGWRTTANQKLVTGAIRRLIELSPLPAILVRNNSQIISPASFCMLDFNPEMSQLDGAHWMMWFHRMECLARLGVVKSIPELQRQVRTLADHLEADGLFTKKLSHPYFARWGAYSGLMLEDNWRTPNKRIYDLSFRSKLILHYAEVVPDHRPSY